MRARIPARAAASIWFRISASSGDTITVGPAPRARNSAVARKYTADLPQPVRWTTRARRPATSALIAVHWSSRSRAAVAGQRLQSLLGVGPEARGVRRCAAGSAVSAVPHWYRLCAMPLASVPGPAPSIFGIQPLSTGQNSGSRARRRGRSYA